jgi:tetratricopeptide (TPR) repeat protein
MLFRTYYCKLLILFFISTLQISVFSQTSSFIKEIKLLPDTLRGEFITTHVFELYKKDSLLAEREINDALIFFKGVNTEYSTLLSAKSYYYYKNEQLTNALKYEKLALENYEKLNDFKNELSSIKRLTRIYNGLNQSNIAINLLINKLKKVEGNPARECILLERIGTTFKEIKNNEKAFSYLQKAEEKLNEVEKNDSELNGSAFSIFKNLGVLYRNNDDFNKAIYYFNKAYIIAEQTDNTNNKAIVLNSLGILYKEKKEYNKAINAFESSIKLKRGNDNLPGISNSLRNLAELYFEIGNLKKAEEYYLISYDLSIQSKQIKQIYESCSGLYVLYDKMKKTNLAYSFLKRAYNLKDSIYNSSISEESARLEKLYNTQKQEKEIEISKIKNQQLEIDVKTKNRERNIFIVSAILLVLFLLWSIRSYLQKKKINISLEEKNYLINKQKQLVEEKQKEVMDSIRYAKKIQNAHLTTESYIHKVLQKLQEK